MPQRVRRVFTRYAVAWLYLAGFCAAGISYELLPADDQAAVLAWSSTNVHNLQHHPVGCMVASAFFAPGDLLAWPPLIALSMLGANAVLGNWRTAVTCATGHVIGTLVSEGILWYQIDHGTMPAADRLIEDVGPSYVVVTAIAVALLWGTWLARAAAAVAFLILIFVGHIFSGLTHLALAPVGHTTALIVGCTLGSYLTWQRRKRAAAPSPDPAGPGLP
jgi:hypothetical protein